MKQLRLKTVTLVAIICMTRPSDLAPYISSSEDLRITPIVVLSLDNIDFYTNGSVSIHFWGIKNDSTRSGFEVNIPPNSNRILDPGQCLNDYMDRTCELRPSETKPLFIFLKPQYKTLKADTIGHVFEEAI